MIAGAICRVPEFWIWLEEVIWFSLSVYSEKTPHELTARKIGRNRRLSSITRRSAWSNYLILSIIPMFSNIVLSRWNITDDLNLYSVDLMLFKSWIFSIILFFRFRQKIEYINKCCFVLWYSLENCSYLKCMSKFDI